MTTISTLEKHQEYMDKQHQMLLDRPADAPEKALKIDLKVSEIEVKSIPLSDIYVDKRFRTDMGDLTSLAASIKKEGLIQPIAICQNPEGSEKPYKLIAGERRFTAIEYLCVKNASSKRIACRIFPIDIPELQLRVLEFAENIYRKDFTWQEECNLKEHIQTLQQKIYGRKTSTSKDAPGWSLKDLSAMTGKSKATLSTDINLAKIMKETPEVDWSKFKTKNDAQKALKHAKKTVVQTINAKKAEKTLGEGDSRKRKLIDSYHVQDFFKGVRKLGDQTMDFIEIDPPYAISLEQKKKEYKYTGYNEISTEKYPAFMQKVFSECYRVLKNNRWMVCWFAPEPWFADIHTWLTTAQFISKRMPGIWVKGEEDGDAMSISAQTKSPNHSLANAYEMFFVAKKGKPELNRPGAHNIFNHKPTPHQHKIHPTERPLELLRDILTTFAGPMANVLVPFAGSGNTLIAANIQNMLPIGFDLTEEYFEGYIIKVHKSF